MLEAMDAILLIYAKDRPLTFQRLTDYWLPEIASKSKDKVIPIIIVCNKCDMAPGKEERDKLAPLMAAYEVR